MNFTSGIHGKAKQFTSKAKNPKSFVGGILSPKPAD
jgi:hypothetical protein